MQIAFDTSTPMCSVALQAGGQVDSINEVLKDNSHSEAVFSFIEKLLDRQNATINDVKSIVVGLGPGSYTGLRVAASAAKGLAYALDIPIYGISSLRLIREKFTNSQISVAQDDLVISCIDARRMEVYASAFTGQGKAVFENKAVKANAETWKELENKFKSIYVVGVGVLKLKQVLTLSNIQVVEDIYPLAEQVFSQNVKSYLEPLDMAYFEPIYVKQFGEL
ncbi:tRNA (adenosine(37)-N6)-threonylcarbamoyltransferase complex dimerization subunit type 1 TsaB [Thermaurantimonas aggregans]|uniref:tRNA (Adenosine(37)-N6)-threonylcarbamoyltransferase complex dimerization subunit type 1 TsaB n=1 Tax=Thermaurantimonas aggregans TaxID=2173829 RepID=A0A401XNI6_9FLAO|nr:tRNA (adenosine(37)-N6)-threonylcarbamoyltransferase complex dimerization subunit type 1 TsaB [Thermaurantimonas aggregans]MCX8148449.1 tRNA (adenosine(37)-N6)-threonylcarbamoyltransferase complex dimerization subunit type 1 TsaB [Thermaurantimonas aggregans]GCD78584.1 tRNA (adenosine(37)-N6)-threonylcarbamoyltransferase complex dimerization subunit type 1 TsaB [Thermaurantimonas aggregans]